MTYMFVTYICVAVILSGCSHIAGCYSKMLLLTDPDALANRISQLETSIVQLQKVVQQLTSSVTQWDNAFQQERATVSSQSTKIQQLENTIANLQLLVDNSLSTYTIWGRTGCPAHTELVYSGYVGGGLHNQSSSSQDVLCLTQNPTFGKTNSYQNGYIYGAEYDSYFYGHTGNGEDMPCAVCMRKSVSKSIMIPGRHTCYAGWIAEYHGYLASQRHTNKSGAKFICIDEHPEFIPGGAANTNAGRMLVPVIAKCGILRSPPYHENYPVTCVVCSK